MEKLYIRKTKETGEYNIIVKRRWFKELVLREHIVASTYLNDVNTPKIALSRKVNEGGFTPLKRGETYPEIEKAINENGGLVKLIKANGELYVTHENFVVIQNLNNVR